MLAGNRNACQSLDFAILLFRILLSNTRSWIDGGQLIKTKNPEKH